MACHQFSSRSNRRAMLRNTACGFGQVALSGLLAQNALAEVPSPQRSLSSPRPHFRPRAKRVIFLFMWGGPSHVDLFDPKPRLNVDDGKPISPESVASGRPALGNALGSPFKFAQHGEGGVWISELFPQLATQADHLCVIRSLHTEGNAHGEALLRLHTGQANLVRPSVGAWLSYGLGSENENLPAYVTISPPRGHGGVQNYGSAFLPAIHQGTAIGSAEIPIAKARVSHIGNPRLDRQAQREQLDLIQALNQKHVCDVTSDPGIEGLIANYELAFRMQSAIPQIMNIDDYESKETHELYGLGNPQTDNFGRQCLLARKFAEAGVRYIQVSTDYTWDHHKQVKDGLIGETAKVDRPIAGLLTDLNRRGLLQDTLVVWGAEFGRTPMVENGDGRNHHPQAFTMWLAGGGVKGGFTFGATDDFGYRPVENPVHMHDLHATILHGMGIDHQRLTYRHAGRDFRLTDVSGTVVHDIWA
jgi:hypothetical protein